MSFSDVAVALARSGFKKCINDRFFGRILEGIFWTRKSQYLRKTESQPIFDFKNPDQQVILHKICHFQPFLKFEFSKTFHVFPSLLKCQKLPVFHV